MLIPQVQNLNQSPEMFPPVSVYFDNLEKLVPGRSVLAYSEEYQALLPVTESRIALETRGR
jgi:hypothetical protein